MNPSSKTNPRNKLKVFRGKVRRVASCPNCVMPMRIEQVLRDKQCPICKIRIVFSENMALVEVG